MPWQDLAVFAVLGLIVGSMTACAALACFWRWPTDDEGWDG